MISNFDNQADRQMKAKKDTVVGYRPLMYFCFDQLRLDQLNPAPDSDNKTVLETVAITCPKIKLRGEISKCCPKGNYSVLATLN